MRKTGYYLTGFILLVLLSFLIFSGNSRQEQPNIVIVLTDDQAYGDVGFNGNQMIHTPVIDSLARHSVVVDRFYVSPVCAPSRASLLTGKYHLKTGVSWVTRRLEQMRSSEITLAELFKQQNYQTAYFGKWHNGAQYPHTPQGQGFDYFFGFCGGHLGNYFDATLEYNGKTVGTQGYIADVLTDSAIHYMNSREEPFVSFVAYNTPHTPYQVSDAYFNRYKALGLDDRTACIYGMCENIDYNVGRMLNALEKSGKLKRTIFVFTSDNGPAYLRFNAGFKGRKAQVDEGGVRVPFLIAYPDGDFANRKIKNTLLAHIDVLPTLLQLANIPYQDTQFDGIGFASLLKNKGAHLQSRLFFSHMGALSFKSTPGAIRNDSLLLTLNPDDTLLFNLNTDPFQQTDCKAKYPSLTRELLTAYAKWLKNTVSEGLQPEPVQLGLSPFETIDFPAHEACLSAHLSFAGKAGWTHDWVVGWSQPGDSIWWPIAVESAATYQATVFYGGNKGNQELKLNLAGEKTSTVGFLTPPYETPVVGTNDRVKRDEVPEKKWNTQVLDPFELEPGNTRLTLKIESNPSGLEIKGIQLTKIQTSIQ